MATDEQVKEAFRTQTALNHPDQVAHLAPAIQKFASDQFRAMKTIFVSLLARLLLQAGRPPPQL